jgi:hypothetical protein
VTRTLEPKQQPITATIPQDLLQPTTVIKPRSLPIKIDKTPPEACILHDAEDHLIVVVAEDNLSGLASNNSTIQASDVSAINWTSHGPDVAESRRYSASNAAGNTLDLCLNIRCQLDEHEAVVQRILYNGKELRDIPLVRNTITFRRLRGVNGCTRPLLGVAQQVSLGAGKERRTVRTAWDVLHGDSRLWSWRGAPCCSNEKENEEACESTCGLGRLVVFTHGGELGEKIQ